MSEVVEAPHVLLALKPPHGHPCNACGLCCYVGRCKIAKQVFYPQERGPCPALRGSPGKARCGLIEAPQDYVPAKVAAHGAGVLSEAAALILYAGQGCCTRINSETVNRAFNARMDQRDIARFSEIAVAHYKWGLKWERL